MALQLGPVIGTIGGGAGEWAVGSQTSGFDALPRNEWTPIAPTNTAMSDGITLNGGVFEVPAGDYRVQVVYRGGSSTGAMWCRIQADGTTWADHESSALDGAALSGGGTLPADAEISVELQLRSAGSVARTPDLLAVTIIRTA